jgi:hypothetical protein
MSGPSAQSLGFAFEIGILGAESSPECVDNGVKVSVVTEHAVKSHLSKDLAHVCKFGLPDREVPANASEVAFTALLEYLVKSLTVLLGVTIQR